MVKLQEVEDEHFANPQQGPEFEHDDDSDAYTDTDSSISSESEDEFEESLLERFVALRDMVPPTARRHFVSAFSSLSSLTKMTLSFSGKALWVISSSALLVGVPYALAWAEEQQVVEMEREQRSREFGAEVLTPEAKGQIMMGQTAQGQAKAAL